ncbi:MAG: AAA family ATPase [Bacteroidales bacterium]|nr:AAA family ATPase [Bacteroidales bacterium]
MKLDDLNMCFEIFQLGAAEIRGIGNVDGKHRSYSGWFASVGGLMSALEQMEHLNLNWYFVFNQIDSYQLDGKMKKGFCVEKFAMSNHCICDIDIVRRKWVMLDFDPVRPSGTSSTFEQLSYASMTAKKVWDFLFHNGFYDYVGCVSGNGYHIMLPCDLEANEQTDNLVSDFIKVISMLFSDENVAIDTQVSNRARLTKLYGTVAHKGEHSALTPHRTSCFKHVPQEIKPIDKAYFEKIVAVFMTPNSRPSSENNYGRGKFSLESFLKSHNIAFEQRSIAGGRKYILKECPFNSEHKSPDSAVFEFEDGRLGFKCFHNSCSSYHWKEFREKIEPFVLQKKNYGVKDFVDFKQSEVQEESVWLGFEQINSSQANDILRIPTGYNELDRSLGGGLAAGGLSVLTGVNGCGKTVFLTNTILNICDKDFKVGLFSGEMQSWRLKSWFLLISRGLFKDTEENNALIEKSLKDKLFVYNNANGNNWDQLFRNVKQLVEEKEVQVVVLDNMACMNLLNLGSEKFDQQSNFIKELAEFARKSGIHIILVAHPRKSFGVVRKSDIAGSYDLSNMADNVFIIHKMNDDFRKGAKDFWRRDVVDLFEGFDNLIEVAKNRDLGDERVIGLYYERYSKRLKSQMAETIHYNWEKEIS